MVRPYRWEDVPRTPAKGLSGMGMGSIAPYPLTPAGNLYTDSEGNTTVSINPFGVPLVEGNNQGGISFSPMVEWVTGNSNLTSQADVNNPARTSYNYPSNTTVKLVKWFEENKLLVGFGVVGIILLKSMRSRRR